MAANDNHDPVDVLAVYQARQFEQREDYQQYDDVDSRGVALIAAIIKQRCTDLVTMARGGVIKGTAQNAAFVAEDLARWMITGGLSFDRSKDELATIALRQAITVAKAYNSKGQLVDKDFLRGSHGQA